MDWERGGRGAHMMPPPPGSGPAPWEGPGPAQQGPIVSGSHAKREAVASIVHDDPTSRSVGVYIVMSQGSFSQPPPPRFLGPGMPPRQPPGGGGPRRDRGQPQPG